MFISDLKNIGNTISVDEMLGEYLATHGLSVLSFKNGKYIFKNNAKFKAIIANLPEEIQNKIKGGDVD